MRQSRRQSIKLLASLGVISGSLPQEWSKPLVKAVILPAHGQTSSDPDSCSDEDVQQLDEPIAITVSATEVRGPVVAPLTGNSFFVEETIDQGMCAGNTLSQTQTTEFSGQIDSTNNQITGDFLIRQFCGTTMICEQIAAFTANQVTPVTNDDLGDYTGQVTGTLTCCLDPV